LGEIVDGKAELQTIADKEGIHINQTIAVGDGANDLPMLNLAGLKIAFHAKPTVKEKAESSNISSLGLDGPILIRLLRQAYRYDGVGVKSLILITGCSKKVIFGQPFFITVVSIF
jgi:hypothetical protein